MPASDDLCAPRWAGQPGRLEVWYLTFTDDATGTGGWVHLETVSPTDGGPAHAHGWMASFPPAGPALVERVGPSPTPAQAPIWCDAGTPESDRWASIGPAADRASVHVVGAAGRLAWDLTAADDHPPLFTFPRAVWERQLLPAAQIVPLPQATVTGTVTVDGVASPVAGGGGLARIYGHGNAQRWGWLHAPLGDDGVLEIVTATARRALLRRLPPMALVQLRLTGEPDWPANPALAAPRFRTRLGADGFSVRGSIGGRHLAVDVQLPSTSRVALRYVDPDGETATCTNSERATATVTVRDRGGAERRWVVADRAHAEVGTRPATATSS